MPHPQFTDEGGEYHLSDALTLEKRGDGSIMYKIWGDSFIY